MNRNQKGFSVPETLLLMVIAIIIAGTGWYVWRSTNKTDKTLDQANKSSSSQVATSTAKSPVTPEQKYLEIKEWGIRLPLSTAIEDAYYVASTGSRDTNGQPNTMWLGLKSLDSKGCDAAQANTGGTYPIGALIRSNPDDTDPVSSTSYKQLNPDGTTLNDHYYAYHSGINAATSCLAHSSVDNISTIDADFKTAAKNIAKQ